MTELQSNEQLCRGQHRTVSYAHGNHTASPGTSTVPPCLTNPISCRCRTNIRESHQLSIALYTESYRRPSLLSTETAERPFQGPLLTVAGGCSSGHVPRMSPLRMKSLYLVNRFKKRWCVTFIKEYPAPPILCGTLQA